MKTKRYSYSEKELQEIMDRFKICRREALTAPPKVLEFLPESQPALSEKDSQWARKVAADFFVTRKKNNL